MSFDSFAYALVGFTAFISLMSVGYVFAGKRIKGSCGGLNAAMTNEQGKKVCGYCGVEVDDPRVRECQKQ